MIGVTLTFEEPIDCNCCGGSSWNYAKFCSLNTHEINVKLPMGIHRPTQATPQNKKWWLRAIVAIAVGGYLLWDNPEWQTHLLTWETGGILLAVTIGFLLSKVFAAQGIHFSLRTHRSIVYVMIFPLLVIVPVCLWFGHGQIAAALVVLAVAMYAFLFYVIGARCPECGARLHNVIQHRGLFAPLRQTRYRCTACDFTYDRFDTEDPPF